MRTFSGPSVFNFTLARPESSSNQRMIFSTDVLRRVKKDKMEIVTYNPTSFLPAQKIGFIFGNLKCKEEMEQDMVNLKVCLFFLIIIRNFEELKFYNKIFSFFLSRYQYVRRVFGISLAIFLTRWSRMLKLYSGSTRTTWTNPIYLISLVKYSVF